MNAPTCISFDDTKKNNFFLIGFMGSGKTHWGKIWADTNQLSFIDLDAVIEKAEGSTVAGIFETKGEDYFRVKEAAALRSCEEMSNCLIACGGGTPCFFDNMAWMNTQGATIYLESKPLEILERVLLEKDTRPLLKKLNRAELLFFIEQKLKEREPFYKQAKLIVSSAELDQDAFPAIISKIIG
ncbi:MAG: shikimate kinase [Ferruginibacter sp.]